MAQYVISLVRQYEVKKRGIPDINGVLRGKFESTLGTIELLVSSGLIGYCIFFFSMMSKDDFHSDPYFHYWLLFDSGFMLFTLGYTYMSKYLQLEGEITKNVYTLVTI